MVGVGFTASFAFALLEMDPLVTELGGLFGLPLIELVCRRLEPVPNVFPWLENDPDGWVNGILLSFGTLSCCASVAGGFETAFFETGVVGEKTGDRVTAGCPGLICVEFG